VDGKAEALDAELAGKGRVNLAAEPHAYSLDLVLRHPDLPRFAANLGMDGLPLAGELAVEGSLKRDGESLAVTVRPSRLGALDLSGEADIRLGEERPEARLALDMGEMPLALAVLPWRGPSAQDDAAGWSTAPARLKLLDRIDGSGRITAKALLAGDQRLEGAEADFTLSGGRLAIERFGARLAEGRIEGSGHLESGARNGAQVTLSIEDARLGETSDWAGLSLSGGLLGLSLELAGEGDSAAALVQSAAGRGRLEVRDAALSGLDLQALQGFDEPVDEGPQADAIVAALQQGKTEPVRIEAEFSVDHGVARAADLSVSAPAATARGRASADLLGWRGDAELRAGLASPADLPPVILSISGPLDAPELAIDAEALAAALVPPPAPEPEPPAEPQPQPEDEATPAEVNQPTPVSDPHLDQPQPQPEPPAADGAPSVPVPAEPEPQATDSFIRGILDKLNKPTQP
jgi:hypothetical protein